MARTKVDPQKSQAENDAANRPNPVAVLQPSRLPIAPRVGEEYGISSPQWRVLVDQIFPQAKSVEAIIMALEYCRHRNLDIFKRPVHIVPMWSNQFGRMVETVWPGVAEIRTTAHRTGQYAGMDPMIFGPDVTVNFTGQIEQWENGAKKLVNAAKEVTFPEWVEVTVYRIVQGYRSPFTLRTYWEEAYASMGKSDIPNEMWSKRPRGQLAKCGEVGVLRMAFPEELGNEYAAEEMEGKVIDHAPIEKKPSSEPPKLADPKPEPDPKKGRGKKKAAEPEVEKSPLEKLEDAINAAPDLAALEALWEAADLDSLSDDAFNEAQALRQGRIAQLKTAAPTEEKDNKDDATYT